MGVNVNSLVDDARIQPTLDFVHALGAGWVRLEIDRAKDPTYWSSIVDRFHALDPRVEVLAALTNNVHELVAKLAAKVDPSIPVIDASLDDKPTLLLPLPRSARPRATEPWRGRLFPLLVGFLGTSALLLGAAYGCGFLP
jgi:hypothetical protein